MTRSRRSTSVLLLSWVWLACRIGHCQATYATVIKANDEECFGLRTRDSGTSIISGSFDCLNDDAEPGEMGVTLTTEETGERHYASMRDELEGMFRLNDAKPATKFSLCFQNHNENDDDDESESSLDVGFNFHITNIPRTLEDGIQGPDAERALSLVKEAVDIHSDWTSMMDHLDFLRGREALHLEMHESIASRLSKWTYIEAVLVVAMAFGQVMYWKKFFETRRYL